MRAGSKPKSPHLHVIRKTVRPSRAQVPIVRERAGDPVMPRWLTGEAAEAWRWRVDLFRERGQSIRGCVRALAHFCALEAELIKRWQSAVPPGAGILTTYRIYAEAFYETPASQLAPLAATGAQGNPFARNGRRPAGGA